MTILVKAVTIILCGADVNSGPLLDSAFTILLAVLYTIGLWRILERSGIAGRFALVPGAREFMLSRTAGREPEGKVYSISGLLLNILSLVMLFPLPSNDFLLVMMGILEVTVNLVHFIYHIRVMNGLIEVYGVRKRWIWLCLFRITRFIPMLVWGTSKSYAPIWKVSDMEEEMSRVASHGTAQVMDKGLTVNLEERSVFEFFRKHTLLRDIHLSIPQGHMVLLLGGSGAGKTTFLNAVNGYEKARAEVMLNGSNMYTEYKKMQYEVGFVPQSEMMRGKDTVLNTLLDSAKLRLPVDVSDQQRRDRVNEVMEIFGLTPVQNSLVEKLSGGQKKRLSISMEFISNPSLFILDEPDSGLDGVMARELFVQLRKIADAGKIVIVITHTPDRVIDLFDDVIVLAKDSTRTGRLAYYGSIEDARRFFGRDHMEQIVKSINRREEGGDGLADEFVKKYAEVQHV